jgi:hypothetical protein
MYFVLLVGTHHMQYNNEYNVMLCCNSNTINTYIVESNIFVSTKQKELIVASMEIMFMQTHHNVTLHTLPVLFILTHLEV